MLDITTADLLSSGKKPSWLTLIKICAAAKLVKIKKGINNLIAFLYPVKRKPSLKRAED